MFSLSVQNINSAVDVLLPFLFNFFIMITIYLTKLSLFNIKFLLVELSHLLVKDKLKLFFYKVMFMCVKSVLLLF